MVYLPTQRWTRQMPPQSDEHLLPLLPCPFCGGKAKFERIGNRRASTIVTCTNCGCTLETGVRAPGGAGILFVVAFQRVLGVVVIDEPIALHHVQSRAVRRAIHVDHGKRPES